MIPSYIQPEHIVQAIRKVDVEGVPQRHQSTNYDLLYNGKRYPPKYIVSLAHLFVNNTKWSHTKFSGGEETNNFLTARGFTVVDKADQPDKELLKQEREHRQRMWNMLIQAGGPHQVPPDVLRELKIYGGAQGIWVDKARTGNLTQDGVTVSVLHTGSSYSDDLSSDGILYHYPNTNRPTARDTAEINATKAAATLSLPIFVITYPTLSSNLRNVQLGWIEGWDDASKIFLISFQDTQPPQLLRAAVEDNTPFNLTEERNVKKRLATTRSGQQRFKFQVFQRYGPSCAVCAINILDVLDAAHIRPDHEHGTNDPRNGLVLCALHHRALDAGIYAIEPNTLEIHYRASGPKADALRITYPGINHLAKKPHRDALEWLWQRWNQKDRNRTVSTRV